MDQDKQTPSTESATALTNKDSNRTAAAVAPVAPCIKQHAADHAASSVPGFWKGGRDSNAHGSVEAADLEGYKVSLPGRAEGQRVVACVHPCTGFFARPLMMI